MFQYLRKFVRNESGAVTVDWVVLCAGIVAMAVAVFTSTETGTLSLADDVESFMVDKTF